jgi:aldose 1-epimerase
MKIEKKSWEPFEGNDTELVEISEPGKILVQVSTFGATLIRVQVPDKDGNMGDIAFGQDRPDDYVELGGYLGAVTGRVANRISDGQFELDGATYELAKNMNGKMTLHGGIKGFNKVMWTLEKAEVESDEAIVTFSYVSPDGEESFPGTLSITTTYHVTLATIWWEFEATTDKATIINITNHSYWNLDGLEALVDDQEVKILAQTYMPGDEDNLVTGEVKLVKGTPLDLHEFKKFSDIFAEWGGVDTSFFCENTWKKLADTEAVLAAELRSPATGRTMKISTSKPIIHMYTANGMANIKTTFGGLPVQNHGAVCFETQDVPNAINLPMFARMVILRPGEKYYHKTVHEFGLAE